MKKKQILLCLICVLIIGLTGCGAKQEDIVPVEENAGDEKPEKEETKKPAEEEERKSEKKEPEKEEAQKPAQDVVQNQEKEEAQKPEKEEAQEPEKGEMQEPVVEEDKPLDVEAHEKLKFVMQTLAGIGKNGTEYDYGLTGLHDIYSGEQNAVSIFLTHINYMLPEPEQGYSDEEKLYAQYSAKQVSEIMFSLTGNRIDISKTVNHDVIEVETMCGDGYYIGCEDWKTEYTGNHTWKVSTEICDIERYNYKMGSVTYTVIENPDSLFDGYSITDVEATPANHSEWAQAYFDYLYNKGLTYGHGYEDAEYRFIYVDDDDIPEIYIASPDSACGYRLLYYSQEGVKEEWEAAEYIERSGLILCSGGRYGIGEDRVYQLVNGELQLIGSGETVETDGYYGFPDNSYSWNHEEISKEEYDRRLNEVFDRASAQPCDNRYNDEGKQVNELESFSSILGMLSSQ